MAKRIAERYISAPGALILLVISCERECSVPKLVVSGTDYCRASDDFDQQAAFKFVAQKDEIRNNVIGNGLLSLGIE